MSMLGSQTSSHEVMPPEVAQTWGQEKEWSLWEAGQAFKEVTFGVLASLGTHPCR